MPRTGDLPSLPMIEAPGPLPHLTAVFGGGGPFGIAYAFGVVDSLTDAGLQLPGSQLLGTSAGSWVAACLATGIPFGTLGELPPVRVPNLRPGLLLSITNKLFGDARSPLVSASALRVSTGRRTLLCGHRHRLADIVAASSAVPWLFAPSRVEQKRYFDGGIRSLVSADLAPPARHLLVVAPIAGPMFGRAGRTMEVLLQREIRRWRERSGGTVHLVRPNRAIAGLARHPLDLFDTNVAAAAYRMAREQTDRLLPTRAEMMDLCSPPLSSAA
jgi:predicted acylesterase/phospholipase RssA